ncbi:MAG: sn-glycerol-3-phosphate ABC transporter ATP-binding protein UgpC [Ignavibacteriales bacterium]|nr:sn-glycerol-3-phosphate ABC transporter ATP-binding protein UgpC [Ignavibacteriales bacterium]
MAEVKLINVGKIYEGKNRAVSNVNIEIKDKEFVVLVGPSGCGKSTTLRMIAGLEEISEGEIYIDGKLVNNVPPKDRDIAMVFQNYALYPHMTVFENMAFGLKLRKFSKEEIKERVNYAAKILDIENLLDRRPKQLSGGQRQRVAVGRAIVRKPKVFLFDEPLSNLDAKLRVQMRSELARLHQKLETTVVYVTHDQTEAMTMGSRIVVMKDGLVHQVDAPLNLYNKPVNKFVAGFIGSPAMNFIDGFIIQHEGLIFTSEKEELSFTLEPEHAKKLNQFINKKVTLGIRPEDFFDADENADALNINLEVVEQMGSEVYVYFFIDGVQINARLKPDPKYRHSSKVKLQFNKNKIHFFDASTGNVILQPNL